MKRRIAGHEWNDDKIDSQCIHLKSDESTCLMTRAALFEAKESDIQQTGYAHSSYLSRGEYEDVVAERNAYRKKCDAMMEALRQVCS